MGQAILIKALSTDIIQQNLRNPGNGLAGWFVTKLFERNNHPIISMSLDRWQLGLSEALQKGQLKNTDLKVLELGFGPGLALDHIISSINNKSNAFAKSNVKISKVYGIDISEPMVTKASSLLVPKYGKDIIDLQVGDCSKMAHIESNSIDAVYHANCACFWKDLDATLREIHRVMKPGASMFTFLPFNTYKIMNFQKDVFVNQDKNDYLSALKRCGFTNIHQIESPLSIISNTAPDVIIASKDQQQSKL